MADRRTRDAAIVARADKGTLRDRSGRRRESRRQAPRRLRRADAVDRRDARTPAAAERSQDGSPIRDYGGEMTITRRSMIQATFGTAAALIVKAPLFAEVEPAPATIRMQRLSW